VRNDTIGIDAFNGLAAVDLDDPAWTIVSQHLSQAVTVSRRT